jgi:hypothetical protein
MADTKKRQLRTLRGLRADHFQHPHDVTATQALQSIPGMETIVSKVMEYGFERVYYLENIASNVRVTEKMFGRVYRSLQWACKILDVEEPECAGAAQHARGRGSRGHPRPRQDAGRAPWAAHGHAVAPAIPCVPEVAACASQVAAREPQVTAREPQAAALAPQAIPPEIPVIPREHRAPLATSRPMILEPPALHRRLQAPVFRFQALHRWPPARVPELATLRFRPRALARQPQAFRRQPQALRLEFHALLHDSQSLVRALQVPASTASGAAP